MAMTPIVVALNAAGEPTAHAVAATLGAEVHGRAGRVARADLFFPNALDHVRSLFAAGTPIVGVCAAGILIRAVAPLLLNKHIEPPVVAVSDDGTVVVPLLGGHRGANRLARQLSEELGAVSAVTTAGDIALGISLDEPPAGWRLANPGAAKDAMAALLAGGGATITGSAPWLAGLPRGEEVQIHAGISPAPEGALGYHPLDVAIGVGCSRDCPEEELIELVDATLAEAAIAPGALAAIGTLDLKADEPALAALSAHLGISVKHFTAETLEAQSHRLLTPSEVVFAEVGCHGVAEGAALELAGPEASLVIAKQKTANATCAVARAPGPITMLTGRDRGQLSLVGIGPGQADWRTPEASRLIAEADELVGYGLYLDLLGPLAAGKPTRDFPLGAEEDRCRYGLERAGEGKHVALICSGDAGIYAMGALVYELLDRGDLTDAARRVEVVSSPGISALQAAAARIGA
ncbi:MAG: cobalamin biosynthesis protein, partial [Pseudomonadota bacterium]